MSSFFTRGMCCESGYYPMGAEFDPRAPWNEVEVPTDTCDLCEGKGSDRYGNDCPKCDGRGEIERLYDEPDYEDYE